MKDEIKNRHFDASKEFPNFLVKELLTLIISARPGPVSVYRP
jgi:hypothetical protein